jgi:hypothetical protein
MQFIGDETDRCVISFLPVTELERPVGFDDRHAFECVSILEWLQTYRAAHPITGDVIRRQRASAVLHPLIINGDASHVPDTHFLLLRAGWIGDTEAQPAAVSDHAWTRSDVPSC